MSNATAADRKSAGVAGRTFSTQEPRIAMVPAAPVDAKVTGSGIRRRYLLRVVESTRERLIAAERAYINAPWTTIWKGGQGPCLPQP